MTPRNLSLSLLVAVFLAACGGGDPEPEAIASVPVAQPTIEYVKPTYVYPDIYEKFRLNFDSAEIIGFAAIPGGEIVKAEDLEVRWHSSGATAPAASPNAPRGSVQRGSDGKLYAELPMFYNGDRGIYVLVKKGFGPYPEVNGQPGAYMEPDKWKLPAGMTIVEIPGINGGQPRLLIDWAHPCMSC